MAADDQIKFELDLDSSQFLGALKEMSGELAKLAGKDKDITALVAQFKSLAIAGAAVAAAYYGVRTAINTVIEAEEIQAINRQFEMLADNVGISGEALKKGLTGAAAGLIDDTNLLKIANQSIVSMGKSAERLPEIMTMARKATALFGGDLEERFQAISQAVATGQTRMLKQIGITVDADKALKDYAKTLGVSSAALNEQGKQQAILNAVLAKGAEQFKNVDEGAAKTKDSLTRIKVAFSQVAEALTLAFEKTLGPTLRAMVGTLERAATAFKDSVIARFGTGVEKSNAELGIMERRVSGIQKILADNEKFHGIYSPDVIERHKKELADLQAQIAKTKAMMGTGEQYGPAEPKTLGDAAKETGGIDRAKQARIEADANLKIIETKIKIAELEAVNASTTQQSEAALQRRIELEAQLQGAQVAALEQQAINEPEKRRQIDAQIVEIQQQSILRQAEMKERLNQLTMQYYDQELQAANSTARGVAAAFKQGAVQARQDQENFGKRGKEVYTSFQNHATSALLALGDGSKSATEAMKGFFFGMLADRAQAEGMLLLASSIWPPNPIGLAAGAGLIALAGFLRAQAGGGSSMQGGGAGGGASGGATNLAAREEEEKPLSAFAQEEQKKKAVTIQIQGNYFETEQTKTRLMEMVREATDATDFKYVQIGGT